MTNYKGFEKRYIGGSDYARILVRTCKYGNSYEIQFGQDDEYDAYIVPENCEIGNHYEKVAEVNSGNWFDFFDDNEKKLSVRGNFENIEIYRAGQLGCIVRIMNGAETLENITIE